MVSFMSIEIRSGKFYFDNSSTIDLCLAIEEMFILILSFSSKLFHISKYRWQQLRVAGGAGAGPNVSNGQIFR